MVSARHIQCWEIGVAVDWRIHTDIDGINELGLSNFHILRNSTIVRFIMGDWAIYCIFSVCNDAAVDERMDAKIIEHSKNILLDKRKQCNYSSWRAILILIFLKTRFQVWINMQVQWYWICDLS